MKRFLTILLLFVSMYAWAQNSAQIRRDPAYIHADGHAAALHSADSAAINGLARKIAARTGLSPALGATYIEDLRRISSRLVEGRYTVLRYLRADEINTVFEPRRERVRQLAEQAEQSGDRQFYSLAYVLAQSIPDFPAEELEDFRQKSTGSWIIENFISREAEAVQAALQPQIPAAPPKPRKKAADDSVIPAPSHENTGSERPAVTDTVIVQREVGRIEVEHTFRLRDTMVFIHVSQGKSEAHAKGAWHAPIHLQGFAIIQAGIAPELTGGLMLGAGGPSWGGYAGLRSNFRTPCGTDYDCKSDGSTDYGQIWTSGRRRSSRLSIAGGLWYQALKTAKIYAGAGYGRRTVCWEDWHGEWARVTDYSGSGLILDAGLILSYRRLSLSVGGEVIDFGKWGLQLGAGISF